MPNTPQANRVHDVDLCSIVRLYSHTSQLSDGTNKPEQHNAICHDLAILLCLKHNSTIPTIHLLHNSFKRNSAQLSDLYYEFGHQRDKITHYMLNHNTSHCLIYLRWNNPKRNRQTDLSWFWVSPPTQLPNSVYSAFRGNPPKGCCRNQLSYMLSHVVSGRTQH